jgi:hypothetical protein
MHDSNPYSLIRNTISRSINPFQACTRNKLAAQLNISRNSTYLLQRTNKIPPPITPPIGAKFWYQYEIEVVLLSMAAQHTSPEKVAKALATARKQIFEMLPQKADCKGCKQ